MAPLSCLSVCNVGGQSVEWIKMPLGAEVGLSPGHIVLDGDPAIERGTAVPHFSAHFALARSPISATAELLLCFLNVSWTTVAAKNFLFHFIQMK